MPDQDPFYHQPAEKIAMARPGQILDSRPVVLQNLLSSKPFQPWDVDAWQIAYRSNNTQGQPIAAIATLIKPRGTASAPRGLMSVNTPENSTSLVCAPSYVLRYGAAVPTTLIGQITVPLQTRFIQSAIDRGVAVIVPDDEGLNSAYSAGQLAANITLDGIRAAISFAPLESAPGVPVGLIGYSGGATGVSRAAEKYLSYAPDLNIVGVAMGGIMVNMGDAINDMNDGIATGLGLASVMGVVTEYPELADYLNQNATAGYRWLMNAKKPLCTGWQSVTFPFLDLNSGLGDLNAPLTQKVYDNENLGKSIPPMPMFIWQSKYDEFFRIRYLDQLVSYYCSDPNTSLQYLRDNVPGHIMVGVDGGPVAALWLIDRILNGRPVSSGCTISDVNSVSG